VVEVAERVWARWRELEEFRKPAIVLLFSSSMPPEAAVEAVRAAASDAISELESPAARTDPLADRRVGAWRAAIAPKGVLLEIGEGPDDFEGLMALIVTGLDQRGVAGSLDVFEPGEVPDFPKHVMVVECRLRVRGERYHIRYTAYGWRAEPECLWNVLMSGVDWCSAAGLGLSLQMGTLPRVVVGPADDLEALLRDAIAASANLGVFDLTSVGAGRYRTVAVEPSFGRVTLIEGGEAIKQDTWQAAVGNLKNFMRTTAGMTVYGFIKHGLSWDSARGATSPGQGWPLPPHVQTTLGRAEAFEDVAAPDASRPGLQGPDSKRFTLAEDRNRS
jgi:hypothetical protein